jgi:LmbE family N-acetylglucosaminyl deacetylase
MRSAAGEGQDAAPESLRLAFAARLAVVAPHIDDETLGCGALIARLSRTHEIHVVFATDGSQSPEDPGGRAADRAALVAVREAEARVAMGVLGVPADRLHFLGFPDGRLRAHEVSFGRTLVDALARLEVSDVLVPFRYDWHADHIAVHQAASTAVRRGQLDARLFEYFVYTRRRLLPAGDVRAYLRPSRVISVPPGPLAPLKRRALECFASQTTRYYPWQRRPVLMPDLLHRMCDAPEAFLEYDPVARRAIRHAAWVRVASAVEPRLKRVKDRMWAWNGG